MTDLFAITDSDKNYVLDFGIASEVKYAKIFAYKLSGNLKPSEICILPNEIENFSVNPSTKFTGSKDVNIYKENYIMSEDIDLAILEEKYGSNFIYVSNDEFKMQDWQAAKKLEHAVFLV